MTSLLLCKSLSEFENTIRSCFPRDYNFAYVASAKLDCIGARDNGAIHMMVSVNKCSKMAAKFKTLKIDKKFHSCRFSKIFRQKGLFRRLKSISKISWISLVAL